MARLRRLKGGRNHRIFLAKDPANQDMIVKEYTAIRGDGQARLVNEFESLSFLWKKGIRCIPKPIGMELQKNTGRYGYLPGRLIESYRIRRSHLDAVAAFFARLKRLSSCKEAGFFSPAAEACFTLDRYEKVLSERRRRLTRQKDRRLRLFLARLESLDTLARLQAHSAASRFRVSRSILPQRRRILSPSDVGFHNILVANEKLFFIDFEYFGWDDPTKTASDFLLQPDRPIPSELAPYFIRVFSSAIGEKDSFYARLAVTLPILGMKWIYIMLNTFLYKPQASSHRAIQLRKAGRYADRLERAFRTGVFTSWIQLSRKGA